MTGEVDLNTPTEIPTYIHINSRVEIAVGLGHQENYFNGYLGRTSTLSFSDIDGKLPSSGIVCLAQNDKIIVARKGQVHRAILVYKNSLDIYEKLELPCDLPKGINLKDALIISATNNFFGQYFNASKSYGYCDNFEDYIIKYFNKEKDNQLSLAEKIQALKSAAIARNNFINEYRRNKT
ncbi:MAG: hypothetical protein ABSF18_03800, partial [Gammaproteobacteria bacterium]